jgi:hypothetical protein
MPEPEVPDYAIGEYYGHPQKQYGPGGIEYVIYEFNRKNVVMGDRGGYQE